jgi:transcription elongation GreA/GreB family factor
MADNVDQIVSFKLDGVTMERRLTDRPVEDMDNEINVKSPVGQVLRTASAGDLFTVAAPGGDLVVEVLRVDGMVHSEELC